MEHQDLIFNRPLQTGTKYLEFDSAANGVAGKFPMACCKKCSCFINVKIWLVVAKVQKGIIVLVLPSTAITKIVTTFDLEQILLDVKHDCSLHLMNKTGVTLQIITNDAQQDVMMCTILLEYITTEYMVHWSLLQWYPWISSCIT